MYIYGIRMNLLDSKRCCRSVKKKISYTIFTLALFYSVASAFNYLPAPVEDHQVITYSQFTLSYNEEHEQPDWVAYEVTKEEVELDRDRCDCFASDARVTGKSASKGDYRSTGFDRGHLSPAEINSASAKANEESFLMSNMCPQLPGFNREVWAELEGWVREKAVEYGKVYVVSGPVFINNLGSIGKNKVTLPGYFYKVILRFDGDKPQTIGFVLPQIGAVGSINDYAVPVNAVETLTGIDFFPELPSSENLIESRYDIRKWGL